MIYYATHARATPWLMGLLFGYLLHGERSKRRSCRLAGWLMQLLWLLALLLLVAVIWSVYPYTQPGRAPMSPLAGAFYLCCSRLAWSLALCWLIWACQCGRGGVINTLLSWSVWQPISRLSYCLYIWHLLVEMLNTGRLKSSQHFSNYDAVSCSPAKLLQLPLTLPLLSPARCCTSGRTLASRCSSRWPCTSAWRRRSCGSSFICCAGQLFIRPRPPFPWPSG